MNYKRLCELIEECSFENAWLAKDTYGIAIFEDKHIVINTVVCILETAIHELIHIDDQEKPERQVEKEAVRVLQSLTKEQIFDLFKRVVDKTEVKK